MGDSRLQMRSTTNELAKERNRAAAERTLNLWISSCISLIGIGIAIHQISRSLRQRFPAEDPALTNAAAHLTSILFVGLGLLLLIIALMQHRLELNAIEQEDYLLLSVNALNRVAIAAILLAGAMAAIAIVFLL